MVARILNILFFILAVFLHDASAQNSKAGLIRFNAGLAQGFMLTHDSRPLFVDGFAEYFIEEKISIKGTCTQLMADRIEDGMLKSYTGISFGMAWHAGNDLHDFSIAMQPGVVYQRPGLIFINHVAEPKLAPSLMFTATYSLFFSNPFHFYISVSENNSFYRGAPDGNINTSWISITGGLGWHVRFKK